MRVRSKQKVTKMEQRTCYGIIDNDILFTVRQMLGQLWFECLMILRIRGIITVEQCFSVEVKCHFVCR